MDILSDLDRRGLVQDTTDRSALQALIDQGPITLYYGCDPTAASLHHGNLIGLLTLRRFQDAGHRPLALAGGATGMVGDPGGRSAERPVRTRHCSPSPCPPHGAQPPIPGGSAAPQAASR